jgi:16S rRNA (guanine527-N7)-methyltransferase
MINERVRDLLESEGIAIDRAMEDALENYVAMVTEWSAYASLVSGGDIHALWERHVYDSLSLAPVLKNLGEDKSCLLDIGSGGGFPSVPLAIILPELRVTLLERSEKKAGFLKRAIGLLKLRNAVVVQGEFPGCLTDWRGGAITARAIERPEEVFEGIKGFVVGGSVFLCQSTRTAAKAADMFHVEQVHDAWEAEGFRRGPLSLVRRALNATKREI